MNSVQAATSIDVLEAAYSFDGTTTGWLRRLTELTTDWDLGMGVVGYVQSAGGDLATPYFEARGTSDYPAILATVQRSAPTAWVESCSSMMVSCGSFREALRSFGHAPDALSAMLAPFGIYDVLALRAQDGAGWAFGITAFSDRAVDPNAATVLRWRRVATHLGSALRLRMKPGHADAAHARPEHGAALVLSPAGKLVHAADGRTADREATRLSQAVKNVERARGPLRVTSPDEALNLWEALLAGRWSLVDRIDTDGRRFVVAHANPLEADTYSLLSSREAAIVRWAVGGAANKEIGYALGLSPSTVAWHLTQAMRKLRVARRVELIGLWRAAHRVDATTVQRARLVPLDAAVTEEDGPLTTAERAVALLAAIGHSDRQIAETRQSSARTVANQLRSVFRKLGVQSRSELARRFADASPA